jgi:signal transduction histidine kinase
MGKKPMNDPIPEKIQHIIGRYPDMTEAPLYSARGLNVYIELIKTHYSYVNIDELLKHANMKIEEIKADGHWFNQKQINAFMDYLISHTNRPEIAREAGRYACAPEALGILRSVYQAFGSPLLAFKQLAKLAADVSLSCHYKPLIHASNKIEITVTPYPGVQESKYQCDNRQGYFEGIFQLFEMPFPKIEHPECMFKNHDYCRYIVSWEPLKSEQYKRYHYLFLVFCLILICIFMFSDLSLTHKMATTAILIAINLIIKPLISQVEIQEYKKLISRKAETDSQSYAQLFEKIQDNYEHQVLFRKLSEAMSRSHHFNKAIQEVTNLLRDRYDRCAILLANPSKSKLIYEAGFGYTDQQLDLWRKTGWFHVLPDSKGTFIRSFREKAPFFIDDIAKVLDDYSMRSIEFASKMNIKSLICCPIYFEKQSFGVLAIANYPKERELDNSDTNLLMGIANQIGVIIQLYRNAENEKNAAMVDMAMQAVHNIKNPASVISSNLMYILDYSHTDETISQIIKETQLANRRIIELTKDFLRFLKPIEMRIEKIGFNELLKNMIENHHLGPDHFKLSIDGSIPFIEADKSSIVWMIEEMIENSKKYGELPVEIKVTKENDFLYIEFKDHGIGIPEKQRETIFKPFFSANKQGTGLGLPNIVKIINEHGGTIRLSDTEIKGTCFQINLPIKQEKKNG